MVLWTIIDIEVLNLSIRISHLFQVHPLFWIQVCTVSSEMRETENYHYSNYKLAFSRKAQLQLASTAKWKYILFVYYCANLK